MGAQLEYYCDGCGDPVGQGSLAEALQMNVVGTSGRVTQIMLCLKPDPPESVPLPGDEAYDPNVADYQRNTSKVNGCARKVLTKSVLARLYDDVAEYTGDPSIKPFPL